MPNRRSLLQGALGGLVAVHLDGAVRWLTPAAAAAEPAPFASFTAPEAALLGAFASTLVLGAETQGVVRYIDHHVTVPPAQSLLTLRYLDLAPPYLDFYRAGLAALTALIAHHGAASWTALPPPAQQALIASLQQNKPALWSGPPAALFYFALRCDAVDVVYGTEAGFAALGIPYLPHISPPAAW